MLPDDQQPKLVGVVGVEVGVALPVDDDVPVGHREAAALELLVLLEVFEVFVVVLKLGEDLLEYHLDAEEKRRDRLLR